VAAAVGDAQDSVEVGTGRAADVVDVVVSAATLSPWMQLEQLYGLGKAGSDEAWWSAIALGRREQSCFVGSRDGGAVDREGGRLDVGGAARD
jgi:hypothetical protein